MAGELGLALLLAALAAQDERVPWTSGRVTGSPDPPAPARVVRVFPRQSFRLPVDLVALPGSRRWAVVEQNGRILSFPEDGGEADLMIDLAKDLQTLDRVPDAKAARESYAIAFHPKFGRGHRFAYVMYVLAAKTDRRELPNGTRISRFAVTDADPPRLDPGSEKILLDWLGGGHNGCDLEFGPDGKLYVSAGDAAGPSPPDPLRTGQDLSDLPSSILRIDVDADDPVPKDNPFVGLAGARPEIWAYGFRNPWRMSFDAEGRLWAGDVGWENWELVFLVERGGNYGWSVMEGPNPVNPSWPRGPTPVRPAAHAIAHPEAASITGGFVYRGRALRDAVGRYVYGDWETRRIWDNPVEGRRLGPRRELARTELRIISFAEDRDRELLVLDYEGGGVHRLVPNEAKGAASDFPRLLSATGIWSDVARQAPAPGVIPYSIRAPMWMDGAAAERWVAVPGSARSGWKDNRVQWPKDSVLAKTISKDGRKLETQLLHFDGLAWNGHAYRWNEAQTDAAYSKAASAACLTCHNPWPGFALTMNSAQLPEETYGSLVRWGILPPQLPRPRPMADPRDAGAPLDLRARSYLAVNCAHCHRFGGGGSALIDLRHDIPLPEMKSVGARPSLGSFDLDDAFVVCGGDPARSVLLYRVSKLGRGRMPHLGSQVVDDRGVALLAEWIASLGPAPERRTDFASLDAAAIDRLLAAPSGALELCRALPGLPEGVRADVVRRALALPSGPVRDLFERWEDPAKRRRRLGTAPEPAEILGLAGDAERGRRLFEGNAVQCKACHRVGEELLGPDLSKVGAKHPKPKLLEAILEPSKQVDPKYLGYLLRTTAGDVLSGILVSRSESEVVLRDLERKEHRIPAAKVERLVPQSKSAMPEYLLQDLTAQEAADLLEYLSLLR